MEFFDLVNISERFLELVNPSTPEKVLALGHALQLREGSRVLDFGCGYAEPLALWAAHFGIVGVGVDVREAACERARKKLAERGLSERIEIVCARGADYPFEAQSFDVATCLGATFIWGGYRETLRALKRAIRPDGRLGIGEVYWRTEQVPAPYRERESFLWERDLLAITREEGFELAAVIRSSQEDWDHYQNENWRGLIHWIEAHPAHPERDDVIAHLRRTQDDYMEYVREYLGWAMVALSPGF
jgi:ubiquinone/menaquinone biosynthesis C-methylase UbiE